MSTATATCPLPVLRRLPVPDVRPPLEVEDAGAPAHRHHRRRMAAPGTVQGVLTLVVPPSDRPVPRPDLPVGEHLTERRLRGAGSDDDDFGPVPTRRADLPDPQTWSRGLVQALVEVLAGLRPAGQLVRWTTTAVHERLRSQITVQRGPVQHRTNRRPIVRRLVVCEPVDGVAEVSAVIAGQIRTRALALRLEGADGRWRVTAMETG